MLLKIHHKLNFIDWNEHNYPLDVLRKIPKNPTHAKLIEKSCRFRMKYTGGATDYAILSCVTNCADYRIPCRTGCNIAHILTLYGSEKLSEIFRRALDKTIFNEVAYIKPDPYFFSDGIWVFYDFSAVMIFNYRRQAKQKYVYIRDIFELAYNNNLQKYPELHPAKILRRTICTRFYLEMSDYLAKRGKEAHAAANLQKGL